MSAQFLFYSSVDSKNAAVIRILGSPVIVDKVGKIWDFEKSYNELPEPVQKKLPYERFAKVVNELFRLSGVSM